MAGSLAFSLWDTFPPAFYPHTLGLIHHEFFGTLRYRLIYMYANRLLMYLKLG